MKSVALLSCALLLASPLAAQSTPGRSAPVPAAELQIAAAVLPLPEEFRASATVLGYTTPDRLTTLRQGDGAFICLASTPGGERFHVACYHRSLDPFMARGRELRAQGVKGTAVDSVRSAEVERGTLRLPSLPAALYSLTGPPEAFDVATRTAPSARPLFVIYVPGATPESIGLSAVPGEGKPWLMDPGTPKAHIMFIPRM